MNVGKLLLRIIDPILSFFFGIVAQLLLWGIPVLILIGPPFAAMQFGLPIILGEGQRPSGWMIVLSVGLMMLWILILVFGAAFVIKLRERWLRRSTEPTDPKI